MNNREFIYATGNPAKLESMRACLAPLGLVITGMNETGVSLPAVDECGETPLENARIKALAYYTAFRRPVFACDSGLYIDGLTDGEQPGLNVRRVNGRRLSDDEMIAHYSAIARRLGGKATARYRNGICLVINKREVYEHFGDDISGDVFALTYKPHPKRLEGFPLDSLSVHPETGEYFYWLNSSYDAGMTFGGFINFFREVIEGRRAAVSA